MVFTSTLAIVVKNHMFVVFEQSCFFLMKCIMIVYGFLRTERFREHSQPHC